MLHLKGCYFRANLGATMLSRRGIPRKHPAQDFDLVALFLSRSPSLQLATFYFELCLGREAGTSRFVQASIKIIVTGFGSKCVAANTKVLLLPFTTLVSQVS